MSYSVPMYVTVHYELGGPSRPILFGFARHGRRRWIFHLEPAIGAAWSVRRPKALRHDALAAERAGLFVDDDAVDLEMAIERDA
jgi:hypothetical protein